MYGVYLPWPQGRGREKWKPASAPHPFLSPLLPRREFKHMKKEKEIYQILIPSNRFQNRNAWTIPNITPKWLQREFLKLHFPAVLLGIRSGSAHQRYFGNLRVTISEASTQLFRGSQIESRLYAYMSLLCSPFYLQ
jgi:hypothetical protein